LNARRVAIRAVCALTVTLAVSGNAFADTRQQSGNPLLGPLPKTKTTIQVWDAVSFKGQPMGKAFAAIDKAFMAKYPNITVKRTAFPYNAYWPAKLQAMEAARQGPDVVMTYSTAELDKGFWPLRGLLTPSQIANIGAAKSESLADPSLHQLPLGTYASTWHYNKALFKKAGLDPNKPPTTWPQLLSTCTKLKAAGIAPIAAGFKDGWEGNLYIYFGFASQTFSPAKLTAFFNGTLSWKDPAMVAALNHFVELQNKGCFEPGAATKLQQDGYTDFDSGKAAMVYEDVANFTTQEKALGAGNVGVMRTPRLPESAYAGQYLDAGSNFDWAITRWSKNCRASFAFLMFQYSKTAQTLLWKYGQLAPNTTSVHVTSSDAPTSRYLGWLSNPENHLGPIPSDQQQVGTALKLWPQLLNGGLTVNAFTSQMDGIRSQAGAKTRPLEPTPMCG
jgi:ABC-type glycerol-3-phosphate transport system substrate-binding protein